MQFKRPSAKGAIVGLAIASAIGSFGLLVTAYLTGYNRQEKQLANERRRDSQLLQLAKNQEAQLLQLQSITGAQTNLLTELKAIADADKQLSEDSKQLLEETKMLSNALTQAVRNISMENRQLHGQILTAERQPVPTTGPVPVEEGPAPRTPLPKSPIVKLIEELLKG